jgi:hypothetical protein
MPLGFNNYFNPLPLKPFEYHPALGPGDLLKHAKGTLPSIAGGNAEVANIMTKLGVQLQVVNDREQAIGITIGKHRELFDAVRGKVDAYSEALKKLFELNPENWTATWKEKVGEINDQLKLAQDTLDQWEAQKALVGGIEDAFSNLFEGIMSGGKNAAESIKQFGQSVLKIFEHLIAERLADRLVDALFPKQGGGFMSILGPLLGFGAKIGGMAALGLASGGTVPPGYPNDSFPARLTSGETILPLGLSGAALQPKMSFDPVEFVIKENQLTGILKKATTKNSIY